MLKKFAMTVSYSPYILHFKEPAGTSRGVYRERKVWYITIREEGTPYFGIGECAPLPRLSCDDTPDYQEILAKACHLLSQSGSIPYADLQHYPSILFGMETAMLSFQASQAGRSPLCLYDNNFSRGEQGITINGLVWMGTFDEMLRRMHQKVDQGFRCVKIKVGAIDWERELQLIRVLREHFPPDVIELRLDANGGFSNTNALERLCELAPFGIHSIEQPIAQRQWQEMADICRRSPIPIALDEELIGVNEKAEKIRLLDTIKPQYIILKPSLHGGISGSEEWMSLARERNIGYWATSALESNIGLNAIAQWCAEQHPTLPQGLGTGQLFTDNTSAPQLDIIGQQLWHTGGKTREMFEKEIEDFRRNWSDECPTLQVYTSGSTGEPRPITVEKSRMEASARMTLRFLRLRSGDHALLCMPLKYIAGKMMVVRSIVGNLRLSAVPPSSHPLQDIAQIFRLFPEIPAEGHPLLPHFLALTPMQAWNSLQDVHERMVFSRIPRIIIGGGAVSPELLDALQCCEGEVYSTYGMTETLSHIAMRRLNGQEQSEWYTPLPDVEVSRDKFGCLNIHAPAVCAETIVTHDITEVDEQGRFRILGRTDNIISSGGIKISLEKLEQSIGTLGVPYLLTAVKDPILGEALTLMYVPDTPETLPEVVAQRLVGRTERHERPRNILPVDEIPLTETGKPARAKAREMAEKIIKTQG